MDKDTKYIRDFMYTLDYIKEEFPFEPYFDFIPDTSDDTIEIDFNILSANNVEIITDLFDRYNEIYGKIFDKYSHNFHTSYSWSLQDDEILDPIIQKYAEMALIEAKKQLNINSISDMFTNANLAVSFINKMRFIFNNYIIDDKTFTSRLNILLKEIEEPFYIDLYLMLKRLHSYDFYTKKLYLMNKKGEKRQAILLDTAYSSTYIFPNGDALNE